METIKELNTQELEQVNGGTSICIGIGFSVGGVGGEADACFTSGATTSDDDHSGVGATACYYLGLGAGFVLKDGLGSWD